MQLYLSSHFYSKLDEIFEYSVANWGHSVADSYISDINEALKYLRVNPKILSPINEYFKSIYSFRVNKHWLLFHKEENKMIALTIIHTFQETLSHIHQLLPSLQKEIEQILKT